MPAPTQNSSVGLVARLRRRFRVEVGTLMVGILLAQALLLTSLAYWGAQRSR
jgi:adenylate cyclase